MNLNIIIASTRPGRVGLPVAEWFANEAKKFNKFDVSVSDLDEINLPLLDEPHHPNLRKYTKDHTLKWSKIIDDKDAFVIVTPEYNYVAPATIINAIDFLFHEWSHKPVAFVSYGGVSAGTRSVQVIKQQVTTLNMMPIREAVNIPFVGKQISDDGNFVSNESFDSAANNLLTELHRWAEALKTMRS